MNILEAFENDTYRMLAFAWGMEAANPFPMCIEGKLAEIEGKREEAQKIADALEPMREPIEAIMGLSPLERRGQASQIRGRVRRILDDATYAVLEARLCVPVDPENEKRKAEAVAMVFRDMYSVFDGFGKDYMRLIVSMWADGKFTGEKDASGRTEKMRNVDVDALRSASGKEASSEWRDRKRLVGFLNQMLYDAVDIVGRRW